MMTYKLLAKTEEVSGRVQSETSPIVPTPTPFTRLGPDIFRPLASANRELMWALLIELYDRFFGPDSDNPDTGYSLRTINEAVEGFLGRRPDLLEQDDTEEAATPVGVRASLLVSRLVDCGWLSRHQDGAVSRIGMRPVVGSFFEMIRGFAEDGATIVAGEVQMIQSSLEAAYRDPEGHSAAFAAAAKKTRELITHLNHTSVRVQELMVHLAKSDTTADYLRDFFESYVSQIFIADYHQLRTKNHPLHSRNDILERVAMIRHDPTKYAALKRGYLNHRSGSTVADVERQVEKDFRRLQRFDHVEVYLDRLDAGVARATRQALTYLQYKLRTPGQLELVLKQVAEAVIEADEAGNTLMMPFLTGPMFAPECLRKPRAVKPTRPKSYLNTQKIDPLQQAYMDLARAAGEARTIDSQAFKNYLEAYCPSGLATPSEALPINCVRDFLVLQSLGLIAFISSLTGAPSKISVGSAVLPSGVQIRLRPGVRDHGEYMVTSAFEVVRN